MVRLKQMNNKKLLDKIYESQFHYGSIKTEHPPAFNITFN